MLEGVLQAEGSAQRRKGRIREPGGTYKQRAHVVGSMKPEVSGKEARRAHRAREQETMGLESA